MELEPRKLLCDRRVAEELYKSDANIDRFVSASNQGKRGDRHDYCAISQSTALLVSKPNVSLGSEGLP